ncbi:MAG: hypothetical protein H0T51_18935 [Pirellulales bacterium]|nr:hypothetical protein [Pirellulales bacterium]
MRVINNDLPPLTGADFDSDGDVDGADFLTWQRNNGTANGAATSNGDADGNGAVNGADLAVWRMQFGGPGAVGAGAPVPEPAAASLAALASMLTITIHWRRVNTRGKGDMRPRIFSTEG